MALPGPGLNQESSDSHADPAAVDGDAGPGTPQFRRPVKRIRSRRDLDAFLAHDTCQQFMSFIERLNRSAIGRPITPDRLLRRNQAQIIDSLLSLLDTLFGYIDDIPAQDNGQSRFGNPSFRLFYDRIAANRTALLAPILGQEAPDAAVDEVGVYLQEAFGDRQRIDYGTGHEANFIAFLLCLDRIGVVNAEHDTDLVLSVFARYLDVMRQLQLKYWLEPAGSHGVWGLDDYHFLPFMFGSAQLIGHRFCRPRAIRSGEIVSQLSSQYLYFACIQFINSVKTVASLRWHSPMLDDISAVKTWDKVNSGMIKMYRGEVINKLPIMQHFMFGSLIPFDGGVDGPDRHDDDDDDDDHCCMMETEFPTCCGIPVPSAIAASAANTRLLPFD